MEAPFTDQEVENFNTYQKKMGIYTCMGNDGQCERGPHNDYGTLKATNEHLICPCGKYTQTKT